MKSPIRLGEALEEGGQVTTASPTMTFMCRPLARKDDAALCEKHGPTTLAEGAEGSRDQGRRPRCDTPPPLRVLLSFNFITLERPYRLSMPIDLSPG
ncbi:PAAR domain-containing protein [Cupriavidus laharis]|uniref:PAAR domain-containing protein n=1 Tax=Cupriavidus laharis TaxID=151654 RepID=UPI001CC797A9|nr:PAAR domain-containing protein [Cupriavidus laharis]